MIGWMSTSYLDIEVILENEAILLLYGAYLPVSFVVFAIHTIFLHL